MTRRLLVKLATLVMTVTAIATASRAPQLKPSVSVQKSPQSQDPIRGSLLAPPSTLELSTADKTKSYGTRDSLRSFLAQPLSLQSMTIAPIHAQPYAEVPRLPAFGAQIYSPHAVIPSQTANQDNKATEATDSLRQKNEYRVTEPPAREESNTASVLRKALETDSSKHHKKMVDHQQKQERTERKMASKIEWTDYPVMDGKWFKKIHPRPIEVKKISDKKRKGGNKLSLATRGDNIAAESRNEPKFSGNTNAQDPNSVSSSRDYITDRSMRNLQVLTRYGADDSTAKQEHNNMGEYKSGSSDRPLRRTSRNILTTDILQLLMKLIDQQQLDDIELTRSMAMEPVPDTPVYQLTNDSDYSEQPHSSPHNQTSTMTRHEQPVAPPQQQHEDQQRQESPQSQQQESQPEDGETSLASTERAGEHMPRQSAANSFDSTAQAPLPAGAKNHQLTNGAGATVPGGYPYADRDALVAALPWLAAAGGSGGATLGSLSTITLRLHNDTRHFLERLVHLAVDTSSVRHSPYPPPPPPLALTHQHCQSGSQVVQLTAPSSHKDTAADGHRLVAQQLSPGQHRLQLAGHPPGSYYENGQLLTALVCACQRYQQLQLLCPVFNVEHSQQCRYDALYVNQRAYCGNQPPLFKPQACYNITLSSDMSKRGKLDCFIVVGNAGEKDYAT